MSTAASNAAGGTKQASMKEFIAPLVAIIVGMFMVILDNAAMNVKADSDRLKR